MKKLIAVLFALSLVAGLAAQTLPSVPAVPTGADMDSLVKEKLGDYTVKAGDTLRTIAANMYKDYRVWPAVWYANKGIINNPEIIEIDQVLTLPKLPFEVGDWNPLTKTLMAEAYNTTYLKYLELGDEKWAGARRWVLLEARFFEEGFIDNRPSISVSDKEWWANRAK